MNYFDKEHTEKLKGLNSSYLQDKKLERLMYIYNFSKNKFDENLKRLNSIKVKYIILGEAPPWTDIDKPRYFYSDIKSILHKTFWSTFFSTPIPKDMSIAYKKLAEEQFLLIDSIPYSLKYNSRIRKKEIYKDFIFEYLTLEISKINKVLEFDKNLKIAFAFKLNGLAIIDSFNGKIVIDQKVINLSEGNISADGTGLPKTNRLKKLFELN